MQQDISSEEYRHDDKGIGNRYERTGDERYSVVGELLVL
jgi:hypothetical protein